MALVRTQVYLTPEQHARLKEEAQRQGISLAELIRRLLDRHLQAAPPEEAFWQIVALGESGRRDVSEEHDRYLSQALTEEHVR